MSSIGASSVIGTTTPRSTDTSSSSRQVNMSDNNNLELREPLLTTAVGGTIKSPPRHAFQLRTKQPAISPTHEQQYGRQQHLLFSPVADDEEANQRSEITNNNHHSSNGLSNINNNSNEEDTIHRFNDHDDDDDDDNSKDYEMKLHKELIRILWGKPYANHRFFWLQSIPISCLLGCIIGAFTLGFVWVLTLSFSFVQQHTQNSSTSSVTISVEEGGNFISKKSFIRYFHRYYKLFPTHYYQKYFTTTRLESMLQHPMLISISTGIMIGIIHVLQLIITKAPPITTGTVSTIFHLLADVGNISQETNEQSVLRTILSCTGTLVLSAIALVGGAPIGPELAVITMAKNTSNIVAKILFNCCACICFKGQQPDDDSVQNHMQERLQAVLLQTSLAAAVSSLLYMIGLTLTSRSSNDISLLSPILVLGPLLLHEMSVISRSNILSIDANIIRKKYRQQKQNRHPSENQPLLTQQQRSVMNSPFDRISTSDELAAATTSQYGLLQRPVSEQQQSAVKRLLLPSGNINNNNNFSFSSNDNNDDNNEQQVQPSAVSSSGTILWPNEHDSMEGLTLQFIATAAALYTIRALLFYLDDHKKNNYPFVSNNIKPWGQEIQEAGFALKSWHLWIAILIGIGCGILSSSIILLLGVCRMIRRKLLLGSYSYDNQLEHRCVKKKLLIVFILPIFACTVHGVLSIWVSPYNSGIGFPLVQAGFNAVNNISTNSTTTSTTIQSITTTIPSAHEYDVWVKAIFCRIFSFVISLGLGGLIGGIVLPITVTGLCVGVLLGSSNLLLFNLPMPFTISCCTAACTVSVCPTPFTAALAVIVILLQNNATRDSMIGPIFIACLSAWAITGGLGIIRYFESNRHGEFNNDGHCPRTNNRRLLSENNNDRFYYNNNNDNNISDDHAYHRQNSSGGNLNSHDVSEDELLLRDVRSTIFGNS